MDFLQTRGGVGVSCKAARSAQEPWEITRDWLEERGVSLVDPSPEGIWWLSEQVDKAF
jgi:hypothetical protein